MGPRVDIESMIYAAMIGMIVVTSWLAMMAIAWSIEDRHSSQRRTSQDDLGLLGAIPMENRWVPSSDQLNDEDVGEIMLIVEEDDFGNRLRYHPIPCPERELVELAL